MEGWQPFAGQHAESYIGLPVCAVLKDGSFYIGTIAAVGKNRIVLNGFQGEGRLPADPAQARAHIQSLGGLGSLFGGLGGWGGFGGGQTTPQSPGLFGGGGGGGFGGWGKGLKIGFNVLSFLFPLFGKFFF